MHLSIVGPTIPTGVVGREEQGLDQTSDQVCHNLDQSVDQMPPDP